MSGLDEAIEEALGGVATKSNADHLKDFYAKYEIAEADRLTEEQIRQIAQGKDDRSNIPKEFAVFQINEFSKECTVNVTYSRPNGENPFKLPEYGGTQKFVDGKYLYFEANVPRADGNFGHSQSVYHFNSEHRHFVLHSMYNNDLNEVGIGKVTKPDTVEWEGSSVLEEPVQGARTFTFESTEQISKDKHESNGMASINGEPWLKRMLVITKK